MVVACIQVAPNNHPTDPTLDPMRFQVGDVVSVVEDGHVFSEAEKNCGSYRFVTVTGAAANDLDPLVAERMEDDIVLARRNLTLDSMALENLPASVTLAELQSITVVRA